MNKSTLEKIGYSVNVVGLTLLLLWIGIFKFTAAEAKAIEALVANSFLVNWMYGIMSLQQVSNFIGGFEIITALLILGQYGNRKVGLVGGVLSTLIFLTTLSFLLTTPGTWRTIEGVLVTDFFILKDVLALGISLQVIAKSRDVSQQTVSE
jgi:reactive chlorine resistance protein C